MGTTALPLVDRRRAKRLGCALDVTARQRGRFPVAAATGDLTTRGCRLNGAGPFPPDSELWVRLPGLESQAARVVWSHGPVTGVAFARALHPAVYARFLPAESRLALVAQTTTDLREGDGPIRQDKHRVGGGLARTSRRLAAPRRENRSEARFADELRSGPMRLTVAEREAQVRDVSASGVRVEGELEGQVGDEVDIVFDGFDPITGRIAWRCADETGLSLPRDAIAFEDA